MRTVTSGFKSAIKAFGKELSARVTVGSTVYYSRDIVSVGLRYEGDLLDALMRECDIELYSSSLLSAEKIDKVEVGITVNGSVEYIDYGAFYITEQEMDDAAGTVTITAYDPMVKAMTDYNLSLDYSGGTVTVKALLEAICGALDVELATQTFYNSTIVVDNEKFKDGTYTFRSALAEIAQVAGGCILFLPDGKLYVKYPTASGETIPGDNLRSLTAGEHYGPINSIVLCRTPQEDNIYTRDETSIAQNGLHEIRIENNQIMDSHREDFIDGLEDALFGLAFDVYELESFGICYFDPYDTFTLQTLDGTSYTALVLNDDIEVTQGLSELMSCPLPEMGETQYKYASTTDRAINKTILRVDKQEQQIEAYISRTENVESDLSGVKQQVTNISSIVMDAEAVNIAIQQAIGEIDSVTTSTGYTFNADGLTITKQGEEMESLIDNTGLYVSRSGEQVLTVNNAGVDAINITANQYLIIGDNSRLEDYSDGTDTARTACFFIGGSV